MTDKQLLQYAKQYYAGRNFRIGRIANNSIFRTLRGQKVVIFTDHDDRRDYITLNDIMRLI